MTEETKKEQIQNEEFKEKEEITTQHINEFIDTYLKIKKLYARYKSLKKNIIDEVGEGEYISQERPNDATIHIQKFKTNFDTILKDEFKKLNNKQKRELFKSGLLKINFKLDTVKYQELKDKNQSSNIDKYVSKRKNNLRFFVKLSPEIKSELSNLAEKEDANIKYEKFAIEAKIEEMLDAIENPDEEEQELDLYDFYFDDEEE